MRVYRSSGRVAARKTIGIIVDGGLVARIVLALGNRPRYRLVANDA